MVIEGSTVIVVWEEHSKKTQCAHFLRVIVSLTVRWRGLAPAPCYWLRCFSALTNVSFKELSIVSLCCIFMLPSFTLFAFFSAVLYFREKPAMARKLSAQTRRRSLRVVCEWSYPKWMKIKRLSCVTPKGSMRPGIGDALLAFLPKGAASLIVAQIRSAPKHAEVAL